MRRAPPVTLRSYWAGRALDNRRESSGGQRPCRGRHRRNGHRSTQYGLRKLKQAEASANLEISWLIAKLQSEYPDFDGVNALKLTNDSSFKGWT